MSPADVLALQRTAGNGAAVLMLQRARRQNGDDPVAGSEQARMQAPRRPGEVIQRLEDLTDNEWNGQATTLSADLELNGQLAQELSKFRSGGGLHAEDRLIDRLGELVDQGNLAAGHYQLVININRSPCGTIGGGKGCAERLIDLAQRGLGGPPATHTFAIVIHARHLYGSCSEERAYSQLAVQQMQHAGIQLALDIGHFDTGAAKALSNLET
ncbi:hypothetical protein [Streptomyces lavenduligriseus]|uniref:hypothetical protein n=1 Tax=Streptomyces lavenduligriseus TaxID=67315 RepID=UPI0004C7544C|nr:hypothetical protein [Streptomyces lavenduligriseus]